MPTAPCSSPLARHGDSPSWSPHALPWCLAHKLLPYLLHFNFCFHLLFIFTPLSFILLSSFVFKHFLYSGGFVFLIDSRNFGGLRDHLPPWHMDSGSWPYAHGTLPLQVHWGSRGLALPVHHGSLLCSLPTASPLATGLPEPWALGTQWGEASPGLAACVLVAQVSSPCSVSLGLPLLFPPGLMATRCLLIIWGLLLSACPMLTGFI